jgi:uncharacterized protein (TIGR03000 family)
MFKRGFSLAACGALVLLLTAAESSRAQFFGGGRGFFWPGLSYPVGPTYVNYARPYYYNPPPTSLTGFEQYTVTTTPIYYGAATSMYYGNYSYSAGGTALRGPGNVAAAAYETPSYPIQPPNYTMRYPVSPPLSVVTDNTAQVDVRLPADAELWFDGQKTSQTGSTRTFHSPALEPGQDYVYSVHARWGADGKPTDETRKVTVHAGDHTVVRFTQP